MEEAKTLQQAKTHPVLIAAGVAVLIFCALGAAALTGILPTATPKAGDPQQPAQTGQAPQMAQAPQPSQAQPAAKPATKPAAPAAAHPKVAAAPCLNCGVVESINTVEVKGKTSGVGAVAGG